MAAALWPVWAALALFVLALVGGTAFAVGRALAAWRDVKRLARVLGAGAAALGDRADEAARKVEAASGGAERLTGATGHLARSLAYARILAGAGGGVSAVLAGLRAAVPRK